LEEPLTQMPLNPRDRLEESDIVPQALALVQLSGDLSILDEIAPYIKGPWDYSESLPEALKARLRDRLAGELERLAAGGTAALPHPDSDTLRRMMSIAVGEDVSPEYVPLALEQMLAAEGHDERETPTVSAGSGLSAIIIGAGASGICAAIQLKRMGIPFTLIEKNGEIGGTWFENRYPGCAVDTPNHFYQFSFAPNDEWPEYFSHQQSILAYLQDCVTRFGLRPSIRFNSEVTDAAYDEERNLWHVTTRDADGKTSRLESRIVISAVGQLNRPSIPAIPGLEDFAGTAVHTATWPADGIDLKRKRVVLIGTGASAVQVGPAIAADVAHLSVLQRSGAWVARRPNIDRRVSADKMWALRAIPFYASWYRFQLFWGFADGLFGALEIDPDWDGGRTSISARNLNIREALERHIRRELEGREDLLDRVIPDYPPFGKRVLADAGWYRMLRRPNVTLNAKGIERIEPDAVVLRDGSRIEADVLIFATGFQAGKMLWPMNVVGRGGVTIRDIWGDNDPRAYLGIVVPDFPNMFVMYGPNTNLGHGGSAIFLAECQMRFIAETLRQMMQQDLAAVEIRRGVHDAYNADIDERLSRLVWSHPSVTTWYKNSGGRIITNQPWRLVEYWQLTHDPDLAEFHLTPRRAA
jgi:4-hydroxyacetophenone monooxygenase